MEMTILWFFVDELYNHHSCICKGPHWVICTDQGTKLFNLLWDKWAWCPSDKKFSFYAFSKNCLAISKRIVDVFHHIALMEYVNTVSSIISFVSADGCPRQRPSAMISNRRGSALLISSDFPRPSLMSSVHKCGNFRPPYYVSRRQQRLRDFISCRKSVAKYPIRTQGGRWTTERPNTTPYSCKKVSAPINRWWSHTNMYVIIICHIQMCITGLDQHCRAKAIDRLALPLYGVSK